MSDVNSSAPQEALSSEPDSVIQAAIWMCQDLDIRLPPIPDVYAEALSEIRVGRIYASDPDLTDLNSASALNATIAATGWPKRGLAFGHMLRGRRAYWFYTLVGDQRILHISLTIDLADDMANRVSSGMVSTAHARLSRYFETDANYFRYVMAPHLPDTVPRTIVTYSDDDGVAQELHASWTAEAGVGTPVNRDEVFALNSETTEVLTDGILIRP